MTTLKDIALEAGVSVGMVSRTLNKQIKGSWPRSAEQVAHIHALADKMGYRPHAGARSARTRSFRSIGLVVVRPFSNSAIRLPSFNASLVDGVHAIALERDFRVSFVCLDCFPEPHADQWPRLLSESCVDGLVLTDFAPPQLQESLRKMGLPAIWLNTNRRTRTDTVTFDDFNAARELTERLLALGHRKIAFAGSSNKLHYSVDERRRGVVAALADAGLRLFPGLDACIPDSDFDDAAARVFASEDRPTAVVAYSPYRATQVERAARHAGFSVPSDVSLATWFDGTLSQKMTPLHYSGMSVGMCEAGQAAAEMLFERIKTSKPCPAQVRRETFLEGESMMTQTP
jgi:LacI family transcriptional regulator